jgi:hypothetical protein
LGMSIILCKRLFGYIHTKGILPSNSIAN